MKDIHSPGSVIDKSDHTRRSQEKAVVTPGHKTRYLDSPFVEQIGHIYAERDYAPLCPADAHWHMLFVRYHGEISLSVWGPMTKVATMPYAQGAEFLYITFTLGTFMPQISIENLLDKGAFQPHASSTSFWLDDVAFPFPGYEHVDVFVDRLVRKRLLVHEPSVDAVREDQPQTMSKRSLQRRFLRATGLTHRSLQSIERAQQAAALLSQGVSLLDTVAEAGYCDQPHMNRALKRYIGQTPTQIVEMGKP